MAAHQSLDSAIQALRNGDRDTARTLLHQLTEAEPLLFDGWLWLAAASDDAKAKRTYLRQALALNPHDARVIAGLRALGETVSEPVVAPAPPQAAEADVVPVDAVAEPQLKKSAAKVAPAIASSPLAMPRFVATDVRAPRPIPWSMIALACVVVLLIPLTFWLI